MRRAVMRAGIAAGLAGALMGLAADKQKAPAPGASAARARPQPVKAGPKPKADPGGADAGAIERPEGKLSMSPAIACSKVEGYEDYTPLDEPAITRDEKLLLYFLPKNFAIRRVGDQFQAHLTEDVRIRARGQKKAVWKKNNLLDYTATSDERPIHLFLRNYLAVRGLPPGEYDADLTLRDELADKATATQVVRFRIKPSPNDPPRKKAEPQHDLIDVLDAIEPDDGPDPADLALP